jgi:hypothetical protein
VLQCMLRLAACAAMKLCCCCQIVL